MKKLCYTGFVAFWSSVATILALGALAEQKEAPADTDDVYTLKEVARHDSREDCWMAIEGQIYDLTAYLSQHPTPPSLLVPYCGTEASKGMRTKGYGNDHSEYAWKMLTDYRVGKLAEGGGQSEE